MSGWHRCKECDLEFTSKKEFDAHAIFAHKSISPSTKKILILGAGFGGSNVLRGIQNKLKNENVSISIVNEENYFLFTPMLPEVASGLLHPSDISIPIRNFCKNSKFYQAEVSSIDLDQKLVTVTRTFDGKVHALEYDYLVIGLGSKNNFFGNRNMEENSFTIKSVEDAIGIRNHAINMMENASQTGDYDLQRELLTFVVIGGGFAGVETAGEINKFVRDSVRDRYPKIDEDNINVVLVSSREGILPEVNKKLGQEAMKQLKKEGVRIFTNTKAIDAGEDFVKLHNDEIIPCTTLIWAGGVAIDPVITSLDCEHGRGGKICVNEFLQIKNRPEVFVVGDCAAIDNGRGGTYPPTAQHALRESNTIVHNLAANITKSSYMKMFSFDSKGMMATLGNKAGVASIMGQNVTGIPAWFIWRTYYLLNIPTFEKKLKVATDWTFDLFFARDLTLVGKIKKKELSQIHMPENVPTLKEQLAADL